MTTPRSTGPKRSDLHALVWSTPAALFHLLERARDAHDFEGAARIQARLRELGVTVLFQCPTKAVEVDCDEVRDGDA